MQGKTAWPREHLTTEQVDLLLTGPDIERNHGAELLDDSNAVIEDLGEDVKPWTVTYSSGNGEEIHGGLSIPLTRGLDWGAARVRPYMDLSHGAITGRFYAGVYVLTTPDTQHGRDPIVYNVTGKNLLYLLDRQIGETYVLAAGLTYLDALRQVITDAGLTIPVRLDGTRQDAVLPATRVWCIGSTRWIDVCNDLMQEIAYTDLYCNEVGTFRAQPIEPVENRPPEHRFDTADESTDLVDADYTETQDRHGAYNTWTFVRRNMAYQPVAGDGLFIYPPPVGTPADEIRPAPLQVIEAADQAALEAEGLRIVAADKRVERRFTISVDPLAIAGHRDVVDFVTAGRTFKMQVTSWSLTPYGKSQWVLGGGTGGGLPERVEQQTTATVTQASPLRVVVDGATVDSPANVLDSATYAVGQRLTVTVRNPQPPLVQGVET